MATRNYEKSIFFTEKYETRRARAKDIWAKIRFRVRTFYFEKFRRNANGRLASTFLPLRRIDKTN